MSDSIEPPIDDDLSGSSLEDPLNYADVIDLSTLNMIHLHKIDECLAENVTLCHIDKRRDFLGVVESYFKTVWWHCKEKVALSDKEMVMERERKLGNKGMFLPATSWGPCLIAGIMCELVYLHEFHGKRLRCWVAKPEADYFPSVVFVPTKWKQHLSHTFGCKIEPRLIGFRDFKIDIPPEMVRKTG